MKNNYTLWRVYGEYVSRKFKCITTWKINWKVIFNGIIWIFKNFESLNNLIFIICLRELCSKSKWENSGRNSSRFQFRCCENNTEMTSALFQNDPPSFASSSKISPKYSVTLSHIIESIINDFVGYRVTLKLVGWQFRALD